MKPLPVLLLALAISLAGCAHRVEPGYVWTLWGTVADFSGTALSVRHKSGRIVTMQIDAGTIFTSEGHPTGPGALAKGARVAVDVQRVPGGGQRARAVRIVWGGA